MKYYAVLIVIVFTTTMAYSATLPQYYQNPQQFPQSNPNLSGIPGTRPPQIRYPNTPQPRPGPFAPNGNSFGGHTVDPRTHPYANVRNCICDMRLQLVCASDGRTYPNNCELNCEIIKNPNLRFIHEGECRPRY